MSTACWCVIVLSPCIPSSMFLVWKFMSWLKKNLRKKFQWIIGQEAVKKTSSILDLKMHRIALVYQHLRDSITTKILGYYRFSEKKNPADIGYSEKHKTYHRLQYQLKPILLYPTNNHIIHECASPENLWKITSCKWNFVSCECS